MPEPAVQLGRTALADIKQASGYEWCLGNGIGGYACGTLSGVLGRRYHGLLIAPVHPPLGRELLIAKADAVLLDGDREIPMHSNHWRGDLYAPQGQQTIESFSLDGTLPVWQHRIDDLQIEQRIWMDHGSNQTRVAFRWQGGKRAQAPVIRLGVLADRRDHHATRQAKDFMFDPEVLTDGMCLHLSDGAFIELRSETGRFVMEQTWIENFYLAQEHERGLEDIDQHLRVAKVELTLRRDHWVGISMGLGALNGTDLEQSLQTEQIRQAALLGQLPFDIAAAPGWVRQLTLAADSFVFHRREPDGNRRRSVIAGYPWFGDWGRDTMIALPGLTLATGRPGVAREILQTFGDHISEGMLPNVFPGSGEHADYNTVDAALWYIEAWRAYIEVSNDREALATAWPGLVEIISAYRDGTRYDIGMDPDDALIHAGVPGQQLTWMDARANGVEVTPRHGKPVEINALWYNALRAMIRFAEVLGENAVLYEQLAERVADGFRRFHRGGNAGLFDVIDGPNGHDASIRPNQIFAASLPYSPLRSPALQRVVVEECRDRLLTPFGLRSLAADDPYYHGRYTGNVEQRDGSYHQGPVWGWLLGHYVLAEYALDRDRELAYRRLSGMSTQLKQACLGQISEIFDGDLPHHPRGAPAQAWSVACTLEAWWRIEQHGNIAAEDEPK